MASSVMQVRTTCSVFMAVFLCGCSSDHFTAGHGDVGQFILQQAIVCGGTPTTNSLPVISGRWRYSDGKAIVVIQMSGEQYPAVEPFLRQAFGEPTVTADDGKLQVYRLSSKGGAVQLSYNAKQTYISVSEPLTPEMLQYINIEH